MNSDTQLHSDLSLIITKTDIDTLYCNSTLYPCVSISQQNRNKTLHAGIIDTFL